MVGRLRLTVSNFVNIIIIIIIPKYRLLIIYISYFSNYDSFSPIANTEIRRQWVLKGSEHGNQPKVKKSTKRF